MSSNQVCLRAVEPLDLELLYEHENNPEVWGAGNTFAPCSRHDLQQHIQGAAQQDIYATRQLRLMIDVRQGDGVRITVGAVDMVDFDPRHLRAEVGIIIYEPSFRRKGYATQAMRRLIRYAADTLYLHQLYCGVAESNAASIALFRKLGFEASGIKKDWRRNAQAFENEIMMQLILPASH
ncbi:MAG: GNAT family N-acetyltransferase [Prevotellaceae bacterium]|jgi:diamine N-acetyltransferase|nr:GNAT family N-acetyltransferase [Prevotellaceae bacterium]